jgi:hypothetical protein
LFRACDCWDQSVIPCSNDGTLSKSKSASYLEYIQNWEPRESNHTGRFRLKFEFEIVAVYLLPFAIGLFTLFVIAPMYAPTKSARIFHNEMYRVILDRFRRDAAFHQPRVELIWAGTVMLAWLGECRGRRLTTLLTPLPKLAPSFSLSRCSDFHHVICTKDFISAGIMVCP